MAEYRGSGRQYRWHEAIVRIPSPDGTRVELVVPGRGWIVMTSRQMRLLDRQLERRKRAVGPTMAFLVRQGLVVAGRGSEVPLSGCSYAPASPTFSGVEVSVSNSCNLHCSFCSIPAEERLGPALISVPLSRRIAAMIRDHDPNTPITITGGEPLLHPQLVAILDAFRSCDLRVALNTNATCTDRNLAREIALRVTLVTISIDGPDATSHDRLRGVGSFARAVAGLRTLREAGCRVRVRAVAMPGFDEDAMRKFATQEGAEYEVNALMRLGRARHNAHDAAFTKWFAEHYVGSCGSFDAGLLERVSPAVCRDLVLLDRACRGGRSSHGMARLICELLPFGYDGCPGVKMLLAFSTNGDVWPCSAAANTSYGTRLRIGNVCKTTSLANMLKQSPVAAEFLADLEHRRMCRDCFARYHCAAACRLVGYQDQTTCHAIRDRVSRLLWRFDSGRSPRQNITAMFGDLFDAQGSRGTRRR